MLAGLLFAIEEAPAAAGQAGGRLVATLPFAGTTLIEYQARQLVAAGAGQVVVVAPVVPPDLLGALHRIGRRGLTVDAVRSIVEAVPLLHPLARVVMMADGLVSADATVAEIAGEGGEAILTTAREEAPAGFERIGGGAAWAGLARHHPARLGEVAALPADYDPQSTLLRVIEAGGAARLALPARALAEGHGIERDAAALERRGRTIVAASVAARYGWFDRFLAAPLARATMPALVAAGVSAPVAAAATGVAVLTAAAALLVGWPRTGMLMAVAAMLIAGLTTALATVRDQRLLARVAAAAVPGIALAAPLLLGRWAASERGDAVPVVLAVVVVAAASLGERAIRRRRGWWGSPPAHALLTAVMTLAGQATIGLALAACYAGATLAAAIEDGRRDA